MRSFSYIRADGVEVRGSRLRLKAGSGVALAAEGTALVVSATGGPSSGIPASIVDVKGDLIVATSADNVARKAAGANGTLLVANSALGDGLEWRVLVDADIPAAIARDSEVAAHTGLTTTAHGGVVASSDARLTDARTPLAHVHPIADVTSLQMTLDAKETPAGAQAKADVAQAAAEATAAGELSAHAAAADPHTGYQKESERAQANGYASLGADGIVPAAQLPVGGGGFTWTAAVKQTADITNSLASFVNGNTDLVFSFVAGGVYIIDLYLLCTSAAATTGYRFAFDTSVAVTTTGLQFMHQLGSGTLGGGRSIADNTAAQISTGVPTAGALNVILASGILVAGATPGTARLVFGPEVAASATFKANSVMRVHKVA